MGLFVLCNHIIGITSLLLVCDLKIWCRRSLLRRVLHFMEIQPAYCSYLQNGLEFFNQILKL